MDDAVEQEFTEFVVARSHALLWVASALTGDQHAAEDLVQGRRRRRSSAGAR